MNLSYVHVEMDAYMCQVHMHLETHHRRVHALHGCDVRVRVRVRVRACVCCSSTPANTSRDREVDIPLGTSMVRSIL